MPHNPYWAAINRKMENEQEAYKRILRGDMLHDKCPTHMAIFQTCRRVGFSLEDMLPEIQHYTTHNRPVYADLLTLVEGGGYYYIAKILHHEYCDIPRLTPPSEDFLSKLMMTLIKTMMDLSLERDLEDFELYVAWSASPYLKSLRREIRSRGETSLKEEVTKRIAKATDKALKDAELAREVMKRTKRADRTSFSRIMRIARPNPWAKREIAADSILAVALSSSGYCQPVNNTVRRHQIYNHGEALRW